MCSSFMVCVRLWGELGALVLRRTTVSGDASPPPPLHTILCFHKLLKLFSGLLSGSW